jgi:hypothetical protein
VAAIAAVAGCVIVGLASSGFVYTLGSFLLSTGGIALVGALVTAGVDWRLRQTQHH